MIMVYPKITKTDEVGRVLNFVQKAKVVCEMNGAYHLTFITDEQLLPWQMVKASTPQGLDSFYIQDVKRKNEIYEVTAMHVSNLLKHMHMPGFSASQKTAKEMASQFNQALSANAMGLPFTFTSTIDEGKRHDLHEKPKSAWDILQNGGNSVLHLCDGKLYRNGFELVLGPRKGAESNVLLAERKNLLSYVHDTNIKDVATRLYLYKEIEQERPSEIGEDETLEYGKSFIYAVVDSPLLDKYPFVLEKTIEVSEEDITTAEGLEAYGRRLFDKGLDKPFEPIEVKPTPDIAQINLGESALIYYKDDDVYSRIDFIAYEYDPIAEEYISMNFGELPRSLERVINKQIKQTTEPIRYNADRARIDSMKNDMKLAQHRQNIAGTKKAMSSGFRGVNNSIKKTKEEFKSEIIAQDEKRAEGEAALRSLIKQTADNILLQVEKIEKRADSNKKSIASLDIRADSITSKVESVERYAENLNNTVYNNYTELKQTANSISSTVYSVKQTADSAYTIASRVEQNANSWGVWVNSIRPNLYVYGSGVRVNGFLSVDGNIDSGGSVSAWQFRQKGAGDS